jgi:FAD/FMN-containing dehydrogenase
VTPGLPHRLARVEDALRRQLSSAVGISGMDADNVVHPANLTQLREALTACTAAGATVAPRGSPRAATASVVIDADKLDSILLDPTALLLRAGAAASWVAIREAASAQRLAVSGLPNVRSERAGESVALGEIAHRTLAGIDLLTNGGELISAGGRTLKDVVGYDLAGLALGSGQRLGAILAVTLRLDPAGGRVPAQPGLGPWRGEGVVDVGSAFAGEQGVQATSPASD